ncbi:O-antigen ligase family protein [Roseateles sp.]|uniref:O-antigen ligase family protein n=1 Tax=Roseateles sp. TaxID=1971397 RepID=UPI003BA865D5
MALLTTPWISTAWAAHDIARAVQLSLMLAASVLLLSQAPPRLPPQLAAATVALLALALAACALAPAPLAALQDLCLHLGCVALMLGLSQAYAGPGSAVLERLMASGPLVYAAVALVIFIAALATGQMLDARALHIGFNNPRFLNHAQTVFVPWLVIMFSMDKRQQRWRWLALAAALFHIGLAYLGVARGTGMAWMAAVLVLALAGARVQALRLAATLACGLLLSVLLFEALPRVTHLEWNTPFARAAEAGQDHSRLKLWSYATDRILSSPWLGAGPMQLATISQAPATHPHNIYLQWASEYGVPAAVLASLLMLTPAALLLKQAKVSLEASDRARCQALAAISIAVMVDATVSGNLVLPVSQLWVAWLYAQMLAALRTRPPVQTVPLARGAKWCFRVGQGLPWLLVTSQLVLALLALAQARSSVEPHVGEHAATYGPRGIPRPRFWLDGQL